MIVALVPARWLARQVGDAERARHLNVLVSSAGLLAFLFLAAADSVPGFCLFRWALERPCPFCGVTHAASAALSGRLAEAWATHPAGLLVALVLAVQLPVRAAALFGALALPWARARRWEAWVNASVVALCLAVFGARL